MENALLILWFSVALGLYHWFVYRPLAAHWHSGTLAGIVVYVLVPIAIAFGIIAYEYVVTEREKLKRKWKWFTRSVGFVVLIYIGLVTAIHFDYFLRWRNPIEFWMYSDLFAFYNPANNPGISTLVFGVWGLVVIIVLFDIGEKPVSASASVQHIRGRQLISYQQAQELAQASRREGDSPLFWGSLWLPSKVATTHFCVVGATGSGKTLTLRLLMQSVLPKMADTDARALVYDAKMDIIPYLYGMGIPGEHIITLNPFDRRCVAWDMAADITSAISALQLATILIPEEKTSQPFFPNTARELLTSVIISFIKTRPGEWDFRDIMLAASSKEKLRQVVARVPETQDVLDHFKNETTANDIMSTLREKLHRFRFIAAAWSKANYRLSLRDWLKSNYVLVLGNDEATRTALDAVNQLIFRRLSELILAQSESTTRRTWIILDEVRQAGKLEGLASLATKGRSKGACLVLGLQDIEGLQEVYGPNVAQEILGQCSNKAILRLENPSTAKWACQLFGTKEVLERRTSTSSHSSEGRSGNPFSTGHSNSSSSSGSTTSEHLSERAVVMASEFSNLPVTGEQNGLSGYYLTPSIGAYYSRLLWDWLKTQLLSESKDVPAVDWRPEEDQYLEPWTDEELIERGLSKSLRVIKEKEGLQQGTNELQSENEIEQEKPRLLKGVGK